jgi:type IV pilus assembly protein PilA
MLARLRKRIDEKEEGFTLIELLVVIIIIGILAAIAIPVFLSQKSKGYEASLKSDLRTAAQDIESSNTDAQNYTGITFGTGVLGTSGLVIAGTSQITVGTDQVTLSAGNSITVVGSNQNAFCLSATSSKITSPAVTLFYSSDKGGLMPKNTTTPCTATAP